MVFIEACSSVSDCVRAWLLGLLCGATFGIFCYALNTFRKFRQDVAKEDLLMLALSSIQCLLAFIYYGFAESAEVILLQRALKTLQATFVCYLFVAGHAASDGGKRHRLVFAGVATFDVVLYLIIVFVLRPSNTACRDVSWVLLSVAWLLVAIAVLALGLRFFRNMLHLNNVLPINFSDVTEASGEPEQAGVAGKPSDKISSPYSPGQPSRPLTLRDESHEGATLIASPSTRDEGGTGGSVSIPAAASRPGGIGARIRDAQQSFFGQKRQQLLVLVLIEAISALLTVIWDSVLLGSMRGEDDPHCEHFLAHKPGLEVFVYTITRLIGLLLPHWAVFFVFFWLEKPQRQSFSNTWDIRMWGEGQAEMQEGGQEGARDVWPRGPSGTSSTVRGRSRKVPTYIDDDGDDDTSGDDFG